MKKRVVFVSIFSAVFLVCVCIGMGCLAWQNDTAYASKVVYLTENDESNIVTEGIVAGEQIELYLEVKEKKLPNKVEENGETRRE